MDCDVVIVGAGSAGCALAARLSEDPKLHVNLLEAGGPDSYAWIHVPIGYFKTVGSAYDWRFTTEPEPRAAHRRMQWPRGKGLGGTSLINGMLYLRGHRADYDQWAALGNAGWSWRDVLPYFMRAQHSMRGAGATSGVGGPLTISDIPHDPLSDAFVAAGERMGMPRTDDFNAGSNEGVGYFQMSTRRGRRMSTARSYLAPARHRNNLTVVTNAHATRVLFAGRRAVGVEYANGTNRETVRARHGVVLCAGAVQSPQLLQSSGVGAPALLERHRIPVVAPLAGVGSNLQDHVQVRPIYRVQGAETLNDLFHNKLLGAREVVKYVFARTGAMAWGVYRAGAFYRSDASVAWPDVQIHFGLVSFDRPLQPPHRFSAVTISAAILRPESRGSIEIASADPMAAPLIRANYLTDPRDRALAIAMVRAMRELAATEPLAHYLLAEERPGAGVTADAALHDWIGQSCTSIFHPVGTCAMGPASDANAVVDARLRVHGLDGLRVVDGSIMPRLVSGNTNAPIIMIGEKAADLLREDLR